MPPHIAPLMAGLAQCHAGVVQALLDVVGITGPLLAANRARLLFDQLHPCTLTLVVTAVHDTTLSNALLLASVDRHTSMRACADTNPQRSVSSASVASSSPFRIST